MGSIDDSDGADLHQRPSAWCVFAVAALVAFQSCSVTPLSAVGSIYCRRESIKYVNTTVAELVFTPTNQNPRRSIMVRLEWLPNPEPKFYTPRGVMQAISFTEAGQITNVPPDRLRGIEDLWPESIRLVSPRSGDYRLYLPYGAGEGPAHPDAVVVRNHGFVDLLSPAPEYTGDASHYPED